MVKMTTEYFRKKSGCNSVNIARTEGQNIEKTWSDT